MIKMGSYLVILYGCIVLLGGLIGYLTAGSVPSLVMGSIFGASLVASGMGMLKEYVWGYIAAVALSAILTLFFAHSYFDTGKLRSGGLAFLSLLMIIFLITLKSKLPPTKS